MPRNRRLRDYLMRRDGRNPYGSAGGYVVSSRRGRRDRGVDYADYERDYRGGDYEYDARRSDREYNEQDYAENRRDYERGGQYDMASDYTRNMSDMHHMGRSGNYRPVEAMGYFTGSYGGGQDMARGGRRDYGYDMNYDMRGRGGRYDYGYDYAGDYGENLTREELEHWRKKLDSEVGDEQAKNFFKKENIEQKARAMGIEMKHFNADELALCAYMLYSDYCRSMKPYVGSNMDIWIKMAEEFLTDPDSAVKGGQKLALYHEIVSGEED